MDRLKISLTATSLVFFSFLITLISGIIGSILGLPFIVLGPNGFLYALLNSISCIGCILVLVDLRKNSPSWYLGVPILVVIAIGAIASLVMFFSYATMDIFPSSDLNPALIKLQSSAYLLLATGAVLLIAAFRPVVKDALTGPLLITAAISLVSVILFSEVLVPPVIQPGIPVTGHSPLEPLYWLYLLLGAPVVGTILIALAFRYRDWQASG